MSEENKGKNPDQQNPVSQEKIDELTQQIAALATEKENVVGELKEDRQKRQELQEQVTTLQQALEDATKANAGKQDPNDVNSIVTQAIEKALGDRDASTAKSNQVAAIDRFVNENKEFHSENDPTGKRREALGNAIKRFNTEGLVSEADFYSVVKDAARLLGTDTVPTNSNEEKPEIPSGPKSSNEPRAVDTSGYSDKERKLMEKNNMSPERFEALKTRNPGYIENLLQYID